MQLLAEIHRAEGINIHGRALYREAVRAIIFRGRELLMVYSSNVGDYKFPGGGVDQDESHEQALAREIDEECGMSLLEVGREIGSVQEYIAPTKPEYDVFKMTSYYYQCEVQDGSGVQKLDDYEQNLGFVPVWINLDQVIQANKSLLSIPEPPEWLRREIFVLEYLKQNIVK